MLYIEKIKPSSDLTDRIREIRRSAEWKAIPEDDTDAVRAKFEELPKESIRAALIMEQHGLCAYCMRRITNDGSRMSIEHWLPLSKDKEQALDYKNMLGVCDGGRKWKGTGQRILCCDAEKDEREITINPQNAQHMKEIMYTRTGLIFIKSGNKILEKDINEILHLNGRIDRDGNRIDTSTEVIKGRREAIAWCDSFYRMLDKKNKLTSSIVLRKITEIEQAEIMPEYAGVKLYFLTKKYRELLAKGKSN